LEFTKDETLSLRGDCILGINSTHDFTKIPAVMKKKIKDSSTIILVKLQVGNYVDYIKGYGDSNLKLSDESAIIIRKSDFICSRTFMINADKAAKDIDRKIITEMRNPNSKLKIIVQIME
jgi:hypothetical protein